MTKFNTWHLLPSFELRLKARRYKMAATMSHGTHHRWRAGRIKVWWALYLAIPGPPPLVITLPIASLISFKRRTSGSWTFPTVYNPHSHDSLVGYSKFLLMIINHMLWSDWKCKSMKIKQFENSFSFSLKRNWRSVSKRKEKTRKGIGDVDLVLPN